MQIQGQTQPKPLARWLRSRWLHPLNDAVAWEQMLCAINPMWSRRDYPARVLQVIDETADTRSLWLQPVARWPGHRAGQHVVVEVEIDGRRLHRSFSLSSAPAADGRVRITLKRQPGARVSAWIQQLRAGDVLRLSAPQGDFLAPAEDAPLLLLSAGSGITPLMAMIEELHARGRRAPLVLVHICRNEEDFIFGARLRELASRWPAFDLRVHFSAVAGRPDAVALTRLLAGTGHCEARVCGPRALVAAVESLYRAAGVAGRVRSESYRGRVLPAADGAASAHAVHCTNTERVFTAGADTSLLQAAEAAGLQPAHGCRIGICMSCQCRKRSGSVLNLRTGERSSEPDELIQLCVSVAQSPLELAL